MPPATLPPPPSPPPPEVFTLTILESVMLFSFSLLKKYAQLPQLEVCVPTFDGDRTLHTGQGFNVSIHFSMYLQIRSLLSFKSLY